MHFLLLTLLLIAVEAKVKLWSFSAGHGQLRSGAWFNEVVATLSSCDFLHPTNPRQCEYLGQQRIDNLPVPTVYNFAVDGCQASVQFGNIYGCSPVTLEADTNPAVSNFCQSFQYSGNWHYGLYEGAGASNTGSFFSIFASVDEIPANNC
jgi:hypothetical protein